MNKPSPEVQRAIIKSAIASTEKECFSLSLAGEGMRAIGNTEKVAAISEALASETALHAFYVQKLSEVR